MQDDELFDEDNPADEKDEEEMPVGIRITEGEGDEDVEDVEDGEEDEDEEKVDLDADEEGLDEVPMGGYEDEEEEM